MTFLKYNKKDIIDQVIWLRLSQLLVNDRYKKGEFKIPIHLALGHEAVAVAIDIFVGETDTLFLSHRNIHFNLIRMGSLKEALDEYSLKSHGLANGTLGSMNLCNLDRNVVYSSSILGNNLSVATGYALGNKAKSPKPGVVIVQTGDGAIEEGSFMESLLFASSHQLPLIFLVENNEWSLGTQIADRRCDIDLQKLGASFGIEHHILQSNDVFEYIEYFSSIRNAQHQMEGPIIVEVKLTTLGYWYKQDGDRTEKKFINYHYS